MLSSTVPSLHFKTHPTLHGLSPCRAQYHGNRGHVLSVRSGSVEMVDGKLKSYHSIDSLALRRSIEEFDAGRFDTAVILLKGICKLEAQAAKVVIELWLSACLEPRSNKIVPQALATLQAHLKESPDEIGLAELLSDAEIFEMAMQLHTSTAEVTQRATTSWTTTGESADGG